MRLLIVRIKIPPPFLSFPLEAILYFLSLCSQSKTSTKAWSVGWMQFLLAEEEEEQKEQFESCFMTVSVRDLDKLNLPVVV